MLVQRDRYGRGWGGGHWGIVVAYNIAFKYDIQNPNSNYCTFLKVGVRAFSRDF
jgi:hypothetical protein